MSNKKLKYVNISTYKGSKQVIDYYARVTSSKTHNYYFRKRIKDFQNQAATLRTKAEREKFTKDFNKFIGFTQNGVGNRKTKATIRSEGQGNNMVLIRVGARSHAKNVSKKPIKKSIEEMKDLILDKVREFNGLNYWSFFYADIYPDWVDRCKEACGLENLTSRQFLDLVREIINRWLF